MKALHLTELAARVVAWHNRHPLARRISVVHVHSMGVVVLPFVAPAAAAAAGAARASPAVPVAPPPAQVAPDLAQGATLRERAMAKARQQTAAAPAAAAAAAAAATKPTARVSPAAVPDAKLEPAFSEDILPPLTPAQVATWTLAQGSPLPAPAGDAPVRQVKTDDGVDTARLTWLWVLTAQVDVGQRRVRLLVGEGAGTPVLGARLWSPLRLAAAAALAALLAAALAAAGHAALKRPARPDTAVAAPAAGAASTAVAAAAAVSVSATATASAAPSAPAPAGSAASARAVATVAAPAASAAAPPASMPTDVEATLGRVALPSLGPRIDRRRQAARLAAGESDPPSAPQPAPTPAAPPAPSVAVAAVAASAAAKSAPVAAPVAAPITAQTLGAPDSKASNFALSTRLLRTRSESQQVAAALRAVLVTPQAPHMQVQVLPTGEDFRVLAWPYSQRAEAEKVRSRLAARGLKVEVVDF